MQSTLLIFSLLIFGSNVTAQNSTTKKENISVKMPKKKVLPGLPCVKDRDECLSGVCRKIVRYTDVNMCTTEGKKCSTDKQCCSLKCDKRTKRCLENYRCASCKSIGTKILKGKTKCCPGLYPDRSNICIPLYPVLLNSLYNSIKSFASVFISNAYADQDPIEEAKEEALAKLNAILPYIRSAFTQPDSSETGISGESALKSYFENKISQANSVVKLNAIVSELENLKNSAMAISQALSTINSTYNNMNIDFALKQRAIADAQDRVNYCISGNTYDQPNAGHEEGSDVSGSGFNLPSFSALSSCLNSVTSNLTIPTMQEMGMIAYLIDGTIPSEVFIQGFVQPDDSLYSPMFRSQNGVAQEGASVNIPFIKRPMTTDEEEDDQILEPEYTFEKFKGSNFKSCRVNLFADYMMAQGDQYYEALFTFLALDYVTSGQGIDDKIVVGEWKRHVQSLDQDYENINILSSPNETTDTLFGVAKDQFDDYNSSVESNIKDYFDNSLTNPVEKKIFTYLFLNGFIEASVKQKIINYYIYRDAKHTTLLLNSIGNQSFPAASSFSLFKITRFEAIKYKMYLYKMIGKFRQKSIKLTCRCVDINGPVNGDKWLEDDVKATYLKYCNDVGKYKLYRPAGSSQSISNITQSQETTNQDHSERMNTVQSTAGLNASVSDSSGQGVVNDTEQQIGENINANNGFTSDGQFSSLNNFQETNEEVSRYDDWVYSVGGKKVISFEKFNKENPDKIEGLGHGIHYQEMLWQMAMTKSEILMEAASENLFSVSQGLGKIKMFLMTFNWGYTKTSLHKEVRTRKIGCVSLILSMFKQLFGHREMNFGTDSEWDINQTRFNYSGSIMNSSDLNVESVMSSFDLRPKRVCNKKHFKRKTKICSRKYYYHCIRNDVEKNSVCNKKLPVGMCIKSVHAYKDWAGNRKFILDPFVPEGTSLPKPSESQSFYNTLSITDFRDRYVSEIKSGASKFLQSEFFSLSGLTQEDISKFSPELQAFEDFSFRYIFYYPKMANKPRYMTEGLIPFFDRLITLSMQMNMGIMMDLNNSALLALQLEESYINVIENQNIVDVTEFAFNGFEDTPFTLSTFQGQIIPNFVRSIPQFGSLQGLATGADTINLSGNSGTPSGSTFTDTPFTLNSSEPNYSGIRSNNRNQTQPSNRGPAYLVNKYERGLRNFADTVKDRFDQRDHLKKYMRNNKRTKELLELEKRTKENNGLFKNSLGRVSTGIRARLKDSFGGRTGSSSLVASVGNTGKFLKGGKGLRDGLASSSRRSAENQKELDSYLEALAAGKETIYDISQSNGIQDSELNKILNGDNRLLAGSGSSASQLSNEEEQDDYIDLSGINESEVEGFSFGANGEVINKEALIKYFTDQGLSKEDASKRADEEIKRRGMSLFQIVSRRYIRSAYPRFLYLRKKKTLGD